MSEELLINVTPQETRVAYVENGVLQEVHIERERKRGLVGNIYKGKVVRVLPGMQAAFLEVGLDRTAFLHVSDIAQPNGKNGDGGEPSDIIMELLREGQELMVQVVKDPMGTKGARLTTQISFPSRYLVYMPGISHVGISQRIEDEAERQRLKDVITEYSAEFEPGGYIARTVAEGIPEEAIYKDMQFLQKIWMNILERNKESAPGSLIHEDMSLVMRTMRDLSGIDIEKVRIDSRSTFDKVKKFASKFIPELENQIEHYPGERPVFDLYGVEDEIQKALERKVPLKSGGYLIIDQTESMTTIDVNTGAFVGHRNLEETIFKTNLESAQAIVRQLRLRNLGGIIIIDFIDMSDAEHKRQVLRALEKHLENDHAKTNVCDVSSLGLVEMTRKRTRESLEHILCEPCHYCKGRASLKTAETVCYEIFREIIREARQFEAQEFLILAAQPIIDLMLDEESTSIAELEEFIGKPLRFQVETEYNQEHFDVVLM
ncbi:MAG: ribonuclease G [Gammaproteobacteria bacterium]|nr:ribonuclease G [Gammaproteobacteria bacterium]MCW8986150.1 ribonuclease G [Gammaproteobacteria bacterium]MCW9030941.1 ribonuclease G [Gammaproteobacteria bacterium]